MLKRAAFWTRAVVGSGGFVLTLLYCAWLLLLRRHRSRISRDVARVFARSCCPAMRVTVVCENEAGLMADTPCVYVVNHQSFLDYPILAKIFPAATVIVGRASMRRIPAVGLLFRLTGHVFIERGNAADAQHTLAALERRIGEQGQSVWMFPEGTRRKTTDVPLLRFRSGAFRLAAAARVPIVPVVVDELKPMTDVKRRRLDRRTVHIRVLAAVHITDASDAALRNAMALTHARMRLSLAGPGMTSTADAGTTDAATIVAG